MPINCPLARNFDGYLCDDSCALYRQEMSAWHRTQRQEMCTWHRPPISIQDILTTEEQLRLLFTRIQTLTDDINTRSPSRVLSQMRKDLNDTRGMLLHFQQKFNERYDKEKKKRKRKKSPAGAVETS